jgi:hypothetical protein
LPPRIFNFGKVFNTAGLVSEFQILAASGVSCRLCVPADVNAFQLRWYKTCSEKTWVTSRNMPINREMLYFNLVEVDLGMGAGGFASMEP